MPLLPRFLAVQQQAEDERKLARILEHDFPDGNGAMPRRSSADGHRGDRRRGLPIVARGVGGTSPGTDPVAALLHKEARGERMVR